MTKNYEFRYVVLEASDGAWCVQMWETDNYGVILFEHDFEMKSWYDGQYRDVFNGPNELLDILYK